ncbi:MAG TPA: hypothetical protein VFE82_07170 [Ramlibacter sp.]|jgi:hypothetical protein|uniref:hypothetical protein n=1 Tax=Ramlibacter sp. TaxID=1917967 RepID=UPI002D58E301|nr:hypothetical protein [Ramlibacter sp.]HZY18246.1 hypothetical protein [Ramlibacter sp.]
MLRVDILRGEVNAQRASPTAARRPALDAAPNVSSPACAVPPVYLRDVFDKWVEPKARTADSIAACGRAVAHYEAQTGNPPLAALNRAAGLAFRTWLQQPERVAGAGQSRQPVV